MKIKTLLILLFIPAIGFGQMFPPASGGGGGVTIGDTQVAFATATNTIGGNAGFTFDPTNPTALNMSLAGPTVAVLADLEIINPVAEATQVALILKSSQDDSMGDAGNLVGLQLVSQVLDGNADGILAETIFAANYSGNTIATLTGLTVEIDGEDITTLTGISILSDSAATGTNHYGLLIGNIAGATNNYAIKTGTGDVVFGGVTEGAATGKHVLCQDSDGKIYRSSTSTDCSN